MNALSFLDQLLKSGTSAVTSAASNYNARQGDVGKYATGAAAGSLLTMLIGSRGGRRTGGKALQLGSVAALGMLAWKTYSEWQAQQARQGAAAAPAAQPQALPESEAQAEAHGRALLGAMVAAAKSDGHLDAKERALLDDAMSRMEAAPALRQWFTVELNSQRSAADVAAAATGPERASEIYLASLLVVDETSAAERAYLDSLAQALRLADGLKAQLEARALAG